jgi:hypothetical protein
MHAKCSAKALTHRRLFSVRTQHTALFETYLPVHGVELLPARVDDSTGASLRFFVSPLGQPGCTLAEQVPVRTAACVIDSYFEGREVDEIEVQET